MKSKIFVICAKEEYEFLSEHKNELVGNNELIEPWEFNTNIDDILNYKACFNSVDLNHSDALCLFRYLWYEKKYKHFKKNIIESNKVIILLNDLFTVDNFDIEEKRMEIHYSHNLKCQIETIPMSSLIKCKKLKYPQN